MYAHNFFFYAIISIDINTTCFIGVEDGVDDTAPSLLVGTAVDEATVILPSS